MSVAALEGIHQDSEGWMSQPCPVEALLETSTRVQINEQEGQKIEDKAHGNSQRKIRHMLLAQVLCVRIIIDMWVAMGTIHVVKVGWGYYVEGDVEYFDIRKKDKGCKCFNK